MVPQNKDKIAVIYCRVSVEDGNSAGLSIGAQEITCTRKAKEDGYTILEVIKDEGKSGGNLKRLGIQRILRLIAEKQINAIYLVHTDRLSRSVADHLFLKDLFKKNNVLLVSLNNPMMDESATSITMDTVMAAFNQFHRLNTAEKVKATMNEKAKAGYFLGKAPLGYKNVHYPNAEDRFQRKVMEPDEKTAPFIKEAYKLYATGNYNVMDINDILYQKGLRSSVGGKTFHSKMYEVLSNPIYAGEVHWGDAHLKEGKHQPLIDRSLFETVQKILKSHNNHACRRRKFKWLLGGFLWCYQHECRYTAEWHIKKNMRIAYYHCTKSGCGKFTEQTKLEGMVADKFRDIEFSDDFIDLVIDKVQNIFYDRRKSYEHKRQGLVNQKTAFEAKLKMAENKMLSETISDRDFIRIRDEIKSELTEIDNRIIGLQRSKDIDVDMAREILLLTKDVHKTYVEANPELKRLLLDFFWDKFEVADGLIIKSHLSTLFNELITYEKVFLKGENSKKHKDSVEVIRNRNLCAQQESNLRPSP